MTRPTDGHRPPDPAGGGSPARRAIVAAAVLVLVIVLAGVAVSWTHAPWRDYVARKPASYVELTVVGPADLPTTFVAGRPLHFAFVIDNVAAKGTHRTVTWVTSVRDTVTGRSMSAGTGSAVIGAGSTKTVAQQVTVDGEHRSEVIVKLGGGQQIDFYVSPKKASAG